MDNQDWKEADVDGCMLDDDLEDVLERTMQILELDAEVFSMVDGALASYPERLVARHEKGGMLVDTVRMPDSPLSGAAYETAVQCAEYSEKWIAVEEYQTREEAAAGHQRWVGIMSADALPVELVDVSTSRPALLQDEVSGTGWRTYRRIGG